MRFLPLAKLAIFLRVAYKYILYVALATVSWDRLLNFSVLGFNLKLPNILFGICFLLSPLVCNKTWSSRGTRILLLAWSLPILALTIAIFAAAGSARIELLQASALIFSSAIPFFVTYLGIRQFAMLVEGLTAFVIGALIASLFGTYQYIENFFPLPQVLPYPDTALGFHRVAAMSYESGYFGYFLILAFSCAVALYRILPKRSYMIAACILMAVLVLANTRAAFLTAPIAIAVMFFRDIRKLPKRITKAVVAHPRTTWVVVLSTVSFVFVLMIGLRNSLGVVFERFVSIFDPNEPSSNSPRIALWQAMREIVSGNWLVGIGPGNLKNHLDSYLGHDIRPLHPSEVVANNAYIQALIDGGVILLLAEIFLIAFLAFQVARPSLAVPWTLFGGWISVVSVSFVIVSYYWNTSMWVVIAIACSSVTIRSLAPSLRLGHANYA